MADNDTGSAIRVDLLGPLRLIVAGSPVDVRGPKRRAVLALLAMAGGRAMTSDQLVDALWPAAPPASGRAALHSHVSRLRSHLGAGAMRLVTLDGGYRLLLAVDGSDVQQSRALLTEARATADGDPAAACLLLRTALALWRGPPLADLSELTLLASAVVGLEQLRREITDLLIGCSINAGEADTALALALDAVAADPLREPAVLLLMRALATTGQAAQALQTGRAYRHRLAEEAGLDPSAELGRVERGIAQGTIGPGASSATAVPTVLSSSILPRPATPLVGRDGQLVALKRLLATERLVTIVGPGGVGKTRLAVELAAQADTAAILQLASITDPAAIPHALAAALGLREVRGDVLAACVAVLGERPELLVVDNCEHLLEPVADVISAILDGCPRVTVLATSREPLGLAAECSSRLAPLEIPSADLLSDPENGRLESVPSVALFLERGARVRPGFALSPDERRLVGAIVRQLDGIPLAIELAAGRLSTFSLTDLSQRLDRALDLLGGGRATRENRHRTLRSTLEWSYQLLSADEQMLFRRLAVFSDGVDLEAAEGVAADLGLTGDPGSRLARLVDTSMMDATFQGRTRYRMLETLRSFGLDRLAAAGEDKPAAQYLVRWAVELTARIDDAAATESEPEADALLRRELPNLRSAWRLARREGLLDDAAAMVLAVSDACSWRDLTEPLDWAEELASDPAFAGHPRAAAVLGSAANSAYLRGDYARAEQLARAGIEQATDTDGSWRCLSALSLAELSRGAYAEVVEHSLAAAVLAPQIEREHRHRRAGSNLRPRPEPRPAPERPTDGRGHVAHPPRIQRIHRW